MNLLSRYNKWSSLSGSVSTVVPRPFKCRTSGTGVEKYVRGQNEITLVQSVPYLELLAKKHAGDRTLEYLPDINFFNLGLDAAFAKQVQDTFERDELPWWSKSLEDVNRAAPFLRGLFANLFLTPVQSNGIFLPDTLYEGYRRYYGSRLDQHGYMIFASTKTNKQLIELKKLIESIVGRYYPVIALCGNATSDDDEATEFEIQFSDNDRHTKISNRQAEIYVKMWLKENLQPYHQGFIVLSKNIGSRSFSVSEIDTVILMKDSGQVIQPSSRCLTGGDLLSGRKKLIGNIIYLGFEQKHHAENKQTPIDAIVLPQLAKFFEKEKQKNPALTLNDAFRRLHKSINIFGLDDADYCVQIKVDDLWEDFSTTTRIIDVATEATDYATILPDVNLCSELLNVLVAKKKGDANTKNRLMNKGQAELDDIAKKKRDKKPLTKEEKELLSLYDQVKKRIYVLNNCASVISDMVSYTGNKPSLLIDALDSIISDASSTDEFVEVIGISPTTYKNMLDNKQLCGNLLQVVYEGNN